MSKNPRSVRLDAELEQTIEDAGVKNFSALCNVSLMRHMDMIKFLPKMDYYANKIFKEDDK